MTAVAVPLGRGCPGEPSAARCGGERLSFVPLVRRLGMGTTTAAALLQVHPRQIQRWRTLGVTWAQADELAIRAGFHPCEVWPDWWSVD